MLEVIAFCLEACTIAQEAGADRIELCDNHSEGGTTPSYGMIKAARAKLHIPLHPIIRPRGGDFLYTADEIRIMQDDIAICKELGCDGVVLGLLLSNGSIDKENTAKLVTKAYPMEVTFHRAFDRVRDPFSALNDIIDCGCTRILTSGLQHKAEEGIELIRALQEKSQEAVIILPGSGIRADNIEKIMVGTGVQEVHSSALSFQPGKMSYTNPEISENLSYPIPDPEEVRRMAAILRRRIREVSGA